MKQKVILALIGSMLCLVGCSGVVTKNFTESGYFYNTTAYSEGNKLDYSNRFLAEGVELPLDLTSDSINSLSDSWYWELSENTYLGKSISLGEKDALGYWGIEEERVIEPKESKGNGEESKDKSSKEGTKEDLGHESLGTPTEENTETTEGSTKTPEEPVEPETEIVTVPELKGTCSSFNGITNLDKTLVKGQMLKVTTGYLLVENEEQSERTKPIDSVYIINYSKEPLKVLDCFNNGWYVLNTNVNEIENVFGLQPKETEDEIPPDKLFNRLSEHLGNPTEIWEENLKDSEYARGKRIEHVIYEYPDFILESVIEETSNGISPIRITYIPMRFWYGDGYFDLGLYGKLRGTLTEVDKNLSKEQQKLNKPFSEGTKEDNSPEKPD